MCGIVGAISGTQSVAGILLDCLKKVEYRGYDSAGLALLSTKGDILSKKSLGKVSNLSELVAKSDISGLVGIGHTRWATQGVPSIQNTHPMITKRLALVHNGIVENHAQLRARLDACSIVCDGQTDTEVIARILDLELQNGASIEMAMLNLVNCIEGSFSICVILAGQADVIIGAKRGNSLIVGQSGSQSLIASDITCISQITDQFIRLEDEQIVFLRQKQCSIIDFDGRDCPTKWEKDLKVDFKNTLMQDYESYMMQEIHQQPSVMHDILKKYCKGDFSRDIALPDLAMNFKDIDVLYIIACGSSYYAGMLAKYTIEESTDILVEVDIASEFRYRNSSIKKRSVAIIISQSGETMDTLEAQKKLKNSGVKTIGMVNSLHSSIAHLSDFVMPIHAGSEISVASTKSFTAQLLVLQMLSEVIKYKVTGVDSPLLYIKEAPSVVSNIINTHFENISRIAKNIKSSKTIIFMARGACYPIALEGALKMKELSYLNAHGIAAGELKHGSMALVDQDTSVIALLFDDPLFSKMESNIQEVRARKGNMTIITNNKNKLKVDSEVITIPTYDKFVFCMGAVVIFQLLAHCVAKECGYDVDHPRNLAKSVTVE